MKFNKKDFIQFLTYGVFGFLAGAANAAFYALFSHVCHISTIFSTMIAWLLANLFSYFCNEFIVFRNNKKTFLKFLGALAFFLFTRLISGGGDVITMYVFVDILGFNDILVKIISTTVFGFLNYILGKFIIFKKDDKAEISGPKSVENENTQEKIS